MRGALAAFLLGLAALATELSLARQAGLLVENTPLAAAIVLALWLAGLALGSRARRAGASSGAAVRTFVVLAVAIVAARCAAPALAAIRAAEDARFPTLPRWFVLAPMILLPAIAAGRLLPELVALARRGARAGSAVAGVYALETLGSAIGAFAGGFVAFRAVGGRHVLDGAALAAVLGALLVRGVRGAANDTPEMGAGPRADPTPIDPRRLLAAQFVAGAGVLALELAWGRLLTFFVPGLFGALAAVLATLLVGTSIGAVLGGALVRRGVRPTIPIGVLLVLSSAGVLVGLAIHPHLASVVEALPHGRGGTFAAGQEMVAAAVIAAILFVPTCVFSAAILPLAVASLAASGIPERGAAARLYAASCAGGVLGLVVAAVLPGESAPIRAVVAGAGGVLALGGALAGGKRLAIASIVVAAALALVPKAGPLLAFTPPFRAAGVARAGEREILAVREDRQVVATVVDLGPSEGRALYTDAFQAAGTGLRYGYMRMLGHLPALLAREPARSLVICCGTGTTAGSLALHSGARTIDVVELSPAVLELLPWFAEANHDLASRGAARFHVGDGREFLARDGDSFDVITLEPLPPYTPAAVHFYTAEFYRRCRARLAAGGVACQWIPIHVQPVADFRVLLKTFASEFPAAWVFLFDQCALLVGANESAARFDAGRAVARAAAPDVAADLARARVGSAAAVFAACVADRASILAACGGDAVMEDDRPVVALALSRDKDDTIRFAIENAAFLRALEFDPRSAVDRSTIPGAGAAAFSTTLDRAVEAKRLLLEARSRPEQVRALAAQALAIDPSDLEARALAGAGSAANAALRSGAAGIETVLADPESSPAALIDALTRAADVAAVPTARAIPFLDHDDATVRLAAAVLVKRRMGDLAGYDPEHPRERRQTAMRELLRKLERP